MFEKITNIALLVVCGYVALIIGDMRPKKQEIPKPRPVTLTSHPAWQERGPASANRVAVIVSDYECPYCDKILASPFYTQVKEAADAGKIRLAVLDFPLNIHAHAEKAAEAAHCAADQNKFWDMHDKLHSKHDALDIKLLPEYAADAGLDVKLFSACLSSGTHEKTVATQAAIATELDVNSTPSVILAALDKNGKLVGTLFPGAPPAKDIAQWLGNN